MLCYYYIKILFTNAAIIIYTGQDRKYVNKEEVFQSDLTRLNIISCFNVKGDHSHDSTVSVNSTFTHPKLIVAIETVAILR